MKAMKKKDDLPALVGRRASGQVGDGAFTDRMRYTQRISPRTNWDKETEGDTDRTPLRKGVHVKGDNHVSFSSGSICNTVRLDAGSS